MEKIHILTFILLIVGGLNWLAVGIAGWDIGELFGGQTGMIARGIYVLVGLAAVYEIVRHKSSCKTCEGVMSKGMKPPTAPGV